ncbi:hypothetical protein NU219Hw_g287t1 [Hortaea werneckii]
MLPKEPGPVITDEETGAQQKTPRRKLTPAKQPWKERTYDSFCPELNLNCMHALASKTMRTISNLICGPGLAKETVGLVPSVPQSRLAKGCASEWNMNLAKTLKVRQDEAYPEDHLEREDARPARPIHEGRGSVPLKMTMCCTHLGLFSTRKYSIGMWRRGRQNGLPIHLWQLKHCGGLNPTDKDIWAYERPFEVIRQYFWGDPKLSNAVQDAWTHINTAGQRNRVIKVFQYPRRLAPHVVLIWQSTFASIFTSLV